MGKNTIINDTIHGSIVLSEIEKTIISSVVFNRLHDVYQNSTVYLTFPCNRTKRFEHSLGTMKLCSDIFKYSIRNMEEDIEIEFFETYKEELLNILKSIKEDKDQNNKSNYDRKLGYRKRLLNEKELPHINDDVYSTFNYPRNQSKYHDVYAILMQSVRIAGLLHDIGHPPYSHIVEFALNNIREKYKNSSNNNRIIDFNDIMNDFFGEDNNKENAKTEVKKLHEQMGDKIVEIVLSKSIDDISEEEANQEPQLYQTQVFKILVKETVQRILDNNGCFKYLHRIIDGTLDGDRLDYVTRDALNSGLSKGKIEYERIFYGMKVIKYKDEYWFCPNIKSLNSLEDFLNRRWEVYKNIIFHHRVIKTDYLLQEAIEGICELYLEKEINKDDVEEQSDLLPADISGLWKALKSSTEVESSYAISQWDDSWLMTVLKKHYFKDFILNKIPNQNILNKQLSELLTNHKYYFSAIKRLEDFLVIDREIALTINKESKDLKDKIETINKKNSIPQPLLIFINSVLSLSAKIKNRDNFGGLISSYILNSEYINIDINKIIEDVKSYTFPKNSIEDIFYIRKSYDIGTKKALYVYDEKEIDNQKKDIVMSIHEVSSISKLLNLSYNTFPQIFIYILKTKKYQNEKLEVEEFLREVGKKIGLKSIEELSKCIENTYKI